jgi:hypothetical protein
MSGQPGKKEEPVFTGLEKKYAGNPWTAPTTITLFLIPVFMIILFLIDPPESKMQYVIAILLFIMFFYLGYSLQMNYFIVKDRTLLIKNQYNRDELTLIPFDEIESLKIISAYKAGICLQVNHINGTAETYQAQSLSKKHWRAFRDDMIRYGITFKDDGSLIKKGFL